MQVEVESVPDTSDWAAVKAWMDRNPTPWGSLSWISARALIDSVNHALSLGSNGLVDQLRHAWVERMKPPADADEDTRLLIIDRRDATRFVIIGDPGEQDASQYVVAPALARAVNGAPSGSPVNFVVIMSDVIYPAGEVDQYAEGVYLPYRNPDPANEEMFRVDAPILGLPGNHDWYDGLSGFMYHFCHQDRLDDDAYGPGHGGRSVYGRLFRILWRRAAKERKRTSALRADWPPDRRYPQVWDQTNTPDPQDTITQPGPYYAVRTRDLLVVCIDTGIDGLIDRDQWDWLKAVSLINVPKVLVTGKPLVVNGKVVECWIDRKPKKKDQDTTDSVWKLVHDPAHRYIATLGGDTHNYQEYREEAGTGLQVHLVSGGGGAYTHATHPYPTKRKAPSLAPSLLVNKPATFPSRAESLAFFANLLIPSVIRTVLVLVAAVVGATAVLLLTLGHGASGEALLVTRVGDWALIGILALAVLRLIRRRRPRESLLARGITLATALLIGVLGGSIAYRLDDVNFTLFVRWWLLLTLSHCVFSALLRRSAWWRPLTESWRPLSTAFFLPGLAVVSVGAWYLVLRAGGSAVLNVEPSIEQSQRLPLWAGVGFFVVGLLGWVLRRVLRPDIWRRVGSVGAPLGQATVTGMALVALVNRVGRPELATGALGAFLLTLGLVVVAMVTVVLITELLARLALWGTVAKITHHLPSLLLIVGTLTFTSRWADSPARMIAAGLPIVIFTLVGAMLLVGLFRRKLAQGYLVPVAVVAIGVPGVYLLDSFGLVDAAPRGAVGAWVDRLGLDWAIPVALGTAVVLLALLVSVVLGHLAFLNAQLLFVLPRRWKSSDRPRMTVEEAERIIDARDKMAGRSPSPELNDAWQYARITWPALGEPGGPLQGKVSEIYSSDVPPFHKNFLELDTTASDRLKITVHEVTVPVPTGGSVGVG